MIRTYFFKYIDPSNDKITEVSFCAETYREATRLFYDFITDESMIFDPPIIKSWTEFNKADCDWCTEDGKEYDISDQKDVFIDSDDLGEPDVFETFEDREILSDIYLLMIRFGATSDEINKFKDIYRKYTVNTDDGCLVYDISDDDHAFIATMLLKYCFKKY